MQPFIARLIRNRSIILPLGAILGAWNFLSPRWKTFPSRGGLRWKFTSLERNYELGNYRQQTPESMFFEDSFINLWLGSSLPRLIQVWKDTYRSFWIVCVCYFRMIHVCGNNTKFNFMFIEKWDKRRIKWQVKKGRVKEGRDDHSQTSSIVDKQDRFLEWKIAIKMSLQNTLFCIFLGWL